MKLQLKLNNGIGALLCTCGSILATGFEHHQQTLCCPAYDCCKKWYVTYGPDFNDEIRYDGKLIG